MKKLLLALCTALAVNTQAQNNVGIGTTTPNAKAILELQANDKGLLVPRITTVQMNAIVTPPNGLLIYNTTDNCFNYYNNGTSSWKSMCSSSTTGISNNGDTVVVNLLKADSIFANYLAVNNAFIKNLFATYIKADSAYIKLMRSDTAYIKFLYSQYIKTDSIYAHLGRFDSLVIKGLSIDSLIKQITTNYLNSKDTVVLTYLRADSIYTHILRADTAFIGYIKTNTLKADTIIGGLGKFDSLYVGGKNISQLITDSIAAQAWLLKGNNATVTNKLGTLNARDLHIYAGGLERISVMNGTGNVGIGQTLPAQKLDILGNQTTTGFVEFYKELKPAGLTGVAGQYLTSAGLGVAPTWTTITLPATTVSNTLTGTNLTTTVNGVTGVPIDLSTIAPATTVSNTYNTNTGALSTTVNGITGTNITLPTANNITDSIKAQAWLLKGNAGTTAGTNFIGTTDNVDLIFKRNGLQSGLINQNLSTTSFGLVALNPANTGVSNSAFGSGALTNNTTGYFNTAIGTSSIAFNTTGFFNTATGANALMANTTGSTNTATGANSLLSNTVGNSNTALGESSLLNNTTGSYNIGVGSTALGLNTVGVANTAIGNASLGNTTGTENTAIGSSSGSTNTTGNYNTYLGSNADATTNNFSKAVAIGYNAKVGASNTLILGGTGVDAVNVGIGTVAPTDLLTLSKEYPTYTPAGYLFNIKSANSTLPRDIIRGSYSNDAGILEIGYWGMTNGRVVIDGGSFSSGTAVNLFNSAGVLKTSIKSDPLGFTYFNSNNVGINTTTPANKLEITQGTAGNSGLRFTNLPNAGVLTTNASGDVISATTPNPANAMFWGLTGNSGTTAGTNFLGTSDNVDVVFKRNGVQSGLINNALANTSFGEGALNPATTGFKNTAIGRNSLQNNTSGIYNTGLGDEALMTNATGGFSVAVGNRALTSATAGGNVAVGADALRFTTTGNNNTAIGLNTFQNNTTGAFNSALGNSAGNTNTTGNYNTFIGMLADATVNSFSKAVALGYNAKVGASNAMVLGGTGLDAVNVGIGTPTPNTNALLDMVSTSKGMLMPRVTSVQRLAINNNTSDATIAGLQVYDLTTSTFWYHDGTFWVQASNNPDPSLGAISIFPYLSIPSDYLECNGAAVSRSTYAALFVKLVTTYGVGDGSTTFNLPDLRGEFVRGFDNARGVDASRVMGSNQTDLFKSHTHSQDPSTIVIPGATMMLINGSGDKGGTVGGTTQASGGAETRPRNVAMAYAIKAIPTTVTIGSTTIQNIVNTAVANAVPAGLVQHFANITAPAGYLECNGAAVSRTTYAALFVAIGTLYGVGNGTTTFNVPDLRGEFIRGADNARGVDAGRVIGSAQTDIFKSHSHNFVFKGGNGASGADQWGGIPGTLSTDIPTSNTGGSETRPRNVAMLPCIKF